MLEFQAELQASKETASILAKRKRLRPPVLAKNVFQVHAIAAAGAVRVRRQLRQGEVLRFFGDRLPPFLIGLEACVSSHDDRAREIAALGHEVKMTPPASVKPYVKRGEMDPADAEEICEAAMLFGPGSGVFASLVLDGPMTGEAFLAHTGQFLLRDRLSDVVVVTDSLPAYKLLPSASDRANVLQVESHVVQSSGANTSHAVRRR